MEEILSEKELHEKFDRHLEDDVTDHVTIHEYKVVGILSALITLDDSETVKSGINSVRTAYRIGGMHINVIDRADDVIDGERGFEQTDDVEKFLKRWLRTLDGEEIDENVKNSEKVAFEACKQFIQIMSESNQEEYLEKMKEVVELEKKISQEDLGAEEEYRKHLESAGICLKAAHLPLREHTGYRGDAEELKEIGKFFQIVDDIQDLDEDNYFPEMTREEARKEMKEIQKEKAEKIGRGASRKIIKIFGRYMPEIDRYVDFKQYV